MKLGLAMAVAALTTVTMADWPVLKTYEGTALRKVKMPLGGIGTGTISLSGRGGLVDWEVMNRPAKGFTPFTQSWPPSYNPSFAIRCETSDGRRVARLLEGPVDGGDYEGGLGSRTPNNGFPRFDRVTFGAAYPLATVAYEDAEVPLEVRLEAMNPLVPGDARASGMPVALLRWRLRNPTGGAVRASVVGTMINFAGVTAGVPPNDSLCARRAAAYAREGLRGVVLSGEAKNDPEGAHPSSGEFALLTRETDGAVTAAVDIREPGWGVAMDRFWSRFVARGDVADTPRDDSTATRRLHAAQLAVTVDVPAGGEATVPFVLAWRFPNRLKWSCDFNRPRAADKVGNWYAKEWPSAAAAARDFFAALPELERKTVGFVQGVLAPDVPAVVKEAALFNLSTLRTETCFRTEDGNFFGWEGCDENRGSCYGNCTHVWGYEHALVDLWPDLARRMLDLEFGPQLDARGHMTFRVKLPLKDDGSLTGGVACADGQMQCVVKACEYWLKTGDAAWLGRTWPAVRRAMAFCWAPGGWDADRDGVMEGCQHNTMDVEYYGPNPQMEFLYLAALGASAKMARAAGDGDFAATCEKLVATGRAWTEKNLFNGLYYEHRIVPPKTEPALGLRHPSMGAKDLSNPDFQLGAGCLVDQLVGDFSSRAAGLGRVVDPEHEETALSTILEKCCKGPDDKTFNPMRTYSLTGETALKMAWYPPERMPRSPFPYYRENMTGFEYVVAGLLAMNGRLDEAERVVRDIRDRYDGAKRNPFDEAECGHHYARALAAWTVYRAFVDRAVGKGETVRVEAGADLAKVRDRIRAARAANPARRLEPVTVELAAGRYELSSALTLDARDSFVAWRAAPGAKVAVTGARHLGPGAPLEDAALRERLPAEARERVTVFDLAGVPASGDPAFDGDSALQRRISRAYEQLEAEIGSLPPPADDAGEMDVFADGRALRRARGPEGRLLKFAPPADTTRLFLGRKSALKPVVVAEDDYPLRWAKEPEPYVCGNWSCDWVEQRQRIETFDAATRTLSLSKPHMPWGYTVDQWFYGFNLLCELDRPGEWYADRAGGRLLVWLPDGAKSVEVSVAKRLVELSGATNVVFSGIEFRQSRNTAVAMKGCSGCRLENCRVVGAGGYGVIVEDGRNCGVRGGEFTDLGGGGVALVDGNRRTLEPSGHFVEDATIHAIGRRYRMYRPAVWLVGVGQRASHNRIFDAPHSAVLFFGNDLTIEGNDIHHVCREANDCGAIYTGRSGLLRGNVIRGNFIHEILGFGGRYCRTIYLDDGFAAAEIGGNVFWQVPWGVFLGGAQDNFIHDNLFVDCATPIFADDRGLGWMKGHVDGRIDRFRREGQNCGCRLAEPPYATKYPELLDAYVKKDLHQPFGNRIERNVFWKGSGEFMKKAVGAMGDGDWWFRKSFSKCPPDIVAVTNNLVDVDPKIRDVASGDFSLAPDSPAFGIGFRPVDFRSIGPRDGLIAIGQ